MQRTKKSNEFWVEALRGEGREEAIRDLEDYVRRIVGRVLAGRCGADLVEELAQESMVRIVQSLPRFRGDSAFKTWAAAIATRVAFTHLRRRRVREDRRGSFEDVLREARDLSRPTPLDSLANGDLLSALDDAIRSALTERQRTAILAELRGIPTVEIAEQLDTSQNALYKLTHDARKKLRYALEAAGFDGRDTPEAVR